MRRQRWKQPKKMRRKKRHRRNMKIRLGKHAAAIEAAGLPAQVRGEVLEMDEIAALTEAYYSVTGTR